MGITFGGLASGLDTNAIIRALVDVQARPIQLLRQQRSEEQGKLSQIGVLEGLVKKLEDKAQELTSLGGFFEFGVEVADPSVANVTVTGAVTPGSHSITVNSLASAARYTFEGTTVTDPDEGTFGAGSIDFTYDGTSYSIAIADGSSLNEIAAAITTAAGEDVAASVVNVGTGANSDYQLVLTGRDTGEDFDLQGLADVGGSIGLGTVTQLTGASNASATVDGLLVERSSNVFSDVLEGLSFTALSEGESTSFTAELDTEGTRGVLQGFVDAYNEVVRFIRGQSSFSEENGPSGALFGDRLLRSVTSKLSSALFTPDLETVQNDTEGYSTLGLIGIDLEDDGTLSIDEDELDGKLAADPEAFEAFFTASGTGVLVKLQDAIGDLLDGATVTSSGETLDSIFTGRRKAIGSIVGSIDDQIRRLESNLERFEESLVQRYANLESIIGGLNSQSAFLAANLSNSSQR